MRVTDLIDQARDLDGGLDAIGNHLDKGPAALFGSIRPRDPADPADRAWPAAVIEAPEDDLVWKEASGGLDLLRAYGESARLTPAQRTSLEAVIEALKRPVIAFEDDMIIPSPWRAAAEPRIREIGASVGRVEVIRDGVAHQVGTAFLVAPNLLLTNRHVVRDFGAVRDGSVEIKAALEPRVDFNEELGTSRPPREFPVVAVPYVSPSEDLAIIEIGNRHGGDTPPPLRLAGARHPRHGSKVYVVGYPAREASDTGKCNTNPNVREAIFRGRYGVKCLQPGQVLSSRGLEFTHDCSTLGGNSGSCVVDLRSGHVLGLHFKGCYTVANWAVPLWKLRGQRFLDEAIFVDE